MKTLCNQLASMGLEPLRVRSLEPTLYPKARANMIGLGLW